MLDAVVLHVHPQGRSVMKTFTVFVTLLAMVALAGQPTRSQDSASEADAVKRVIEALSVAINAEKLDELLASYAEDARIDSKATKSIVSKAQYGEAVLRAT
jgi:hypothetical protein